MRNVRLTSMVVGCVSSLLLAATLRTMAADAPPQQLEGTDYQESWRQVGPDEGHLGQRLRSHHVRISEDGMVPGRLSVINPATGDPGSIQRIRVHFVQGGKVVQQVQPGEGGIFQVPGLEPGVYSMIAAGPAGFMAYSVFVLPALNAQAANQPAQFRMVTFQKEEAMLQIDGAAVPPADFSALRLLVQSYVPDSAILTQLTEPIGPDLPKQAISRGGFPGKGEKAEPEAGTTIRSHSVRLQPDGRLLGRIRRLHPESGRPLRVRRTNVFFIHDDQIVAQTPVNELGTFVVRGIKPGVHSVVAVGVEGFLAFAVHILPGEGQRETSVESTVAKPVSHVRLVADGGNPAGELEIDAALIDRQDFAQLRSVFGNNMPGGLGPGLGGPAMGGPGGGAGGAGGGVGGGAGGAGAGGMADGLLGAGLAVGAGAAAAAAMQDDEVASPARP